MATKKITSKTSEPLDPRVADKLLDLLSTDNEFRRLFKKDPLAALVRAGYEHRDSAPIKAEQVNAQSPATCLQVKRIASKRAIASARTEIRDTLISGLGFIPHKLDVGYAGSSEPRSRRK